MLSIRIYLLGLAGPPQGKLHSISWQSCDRMVHLKRVSVEQLTVGMLADSLFLSRLKDCKAVMYIVAAYHCTRLECLPNGALEREDLHLLK